MELNKSLFPNLKKHNYSFKCYHFMLNVNYINNLKTFRQIKILKYDVLQIQIKKKHTFLYKDLWLIVYGKFM